MDALPPPPPAVIASKLDAPGDIYARDAREAELCDRASRPDWLYLGGLVVLDVAGIYAGTLASLKYSGSGPSLLGPVLVGLPWGATIGGGWLALPKCDPEWIGTPPREGDVHDGSPLALSLALLAGATAPVLYGVFIGNNLPQEWSDFDRAVHLGVAGVAGFVGALVPYLLPPRTVRATRELEHLRLAPTGKAGAAGALLTYERPF